MSDLSEIPPNLYYLRAEDVMYCYIPKVASSRFKHLLRKQEGFENWNDSSAIHGRKNGLRRLMWLPYHVAMQKMKKPNVKKFVVVRDPFSRLVSAYQNKIASPWPDQRVDFWEKHIRNECPHFVNSMQMAREGPLMSIEQFLSCLLSEDNIAQSNEHWRPQTQLCALDFIQYDRHLHLESLHSDAADLIQFLGWKENITSFQFHRNPIYSRPLAQFFSEEAIQMVLRYYEKDFEVLGYSKVPLGNIDFYSVFDGTNFQPGFVPPSQ